MANQQPNPGMSSGAKVGIAIAAAVGIVCLFSLGLWVWWRRRQRRQMAKDMVNFVDGDIVNLVDGGRFEKPSKPTGQYESFNGSSSSQSAAPSPVCYHAPVYYTTPQVDSYTEYYARPTPAPPASTSSYTPSQEIHPLRDSPSPSEPIEPIPPSAPVASVVPVAPIDNTGNAWSNAGRHPWSPPDYEAHVPQTATSMQAEHHFNVLPRQDQEGQHADVSDEPPIVALPAILPDPRPEPQAELPAREGHHGWGFEQEMDAPQQPPPKRQAPPQGNDFEEQKFLLSDVLMLREEKVRPTTTGGPAG